MAAARSSGVMDFGELKRRLALNIIALMSSAFSVPSLAKADCRASTGCVTVVDARCTAAGPVPSIVALAAALSILSAADTAPRIRLRIGRRMVFAEGMGRDDSAADMGMFCGSLSSITAPVAASTGALPPEAAEIGRAHV